MASSRPRPRAGGRSSRRPTTSPAPPIASTRPRSSTAGSSPRARPTWSWTSGLLAETYGGHVLVLPAGERHDPRRRPPPRPGAGRRAPLPRRAATDVVDLILDPLAYGFMQRGLVAARPGRHRLRGHGRVRRPRGPGLHRRCGQPRGVPGPGHRLHARHPAVHRRRRRRGRDRAGDRCVARRGGLRFDTAVGVLFAGMFAFGILLFSTIDDYVGDLFSYLLGNVLGITFVRPRPDRGPRRRRPRWSSRSCARSSCTPRSTRPGRPPPGCRSTRLDYLLLGLSG